MKLWKDLGSSLRSSTISLSYSPISTLLPIQGLTHICLACLLLLLLAISCWRCTIWSCWFRTKKAMTSLLWGFIVVQVARGTWKGWWGTWNVESAEMFHPQQVDCYWWQMRKLQLFIGRQSSAVDQWYIRNSYVVITYLLRILTWFLRKSCAII